MDHNDSLTEKKASLVPVPLVAESQVADSQVADSQVAELRVAELRVAELRVAELPRRTGSQSAFRLALARILSDSSLDADDYVQNYSGGRGAE